MSARETLLVRIYLTQSQARLEHLLQLLFESKEFPGLTVFRGQSGFGTSVVPDPENLAHTENPPVVLEFYNDRDAALEQAERIQRLVGARHVVMWPVEKLASAEKSARKK